MRFHRVLFRQANGVVPVLLRTSKFILLKIFSTVMMRMTLCGNSPKPWPHSRSMRVQRLQLCQAWPVAGRQGVARPQHRAKFASTNFSLKLELGDRQSETLEFH